MNAAYVAQKVYAQFAKPPGLTFTQAGNRIYLYSRKMSFKAREFAEIDSKGDSTWPLRKI